LSCKQFLPEISKSAKRDHLKYDRPPWNDADNGISWLEPTTDGKLRCEGGYRDPGRCRA
jgi:hypothetical protein